MQEAGPRRVCKLHEHIRHCGEGVDGVAQRLPLVAAARDRRGAGGRGQKQGRERQQSARQRHPALLCPRGTRTQFSHPPNFCNFFPRASATHSKRRRQRDQRLDKERLFNKPVVISHPMAAALAAALAATATVTAAAPAPPTQLNGHPLRLDSGGEIVGWMDPATAMDQLVGSSLGWMLANGTAPAPNGLPPYFTYPVYPLRDYPHEPVTMFTRWSWAATTYFAYSGDDTLVREGVRMLEYLIANGTTPDDPSWAWRRVPYASSDGGAVRYRGASGEDHYHYGCSFGPAPYRDKRCFIGHGDGYGVIETDKVAAAASAYVLMWKLSGRSVLMDAALACSAALVRNIEHGNTNATHSPWPFRVFAETGTVREAYTSHVISAVRLFDELLELSSAGRLPAGADLTGVAEARATAWDWMMAYPMRNQAWCNFCEDIITQEITAEIVANGSCNVNSITPMLVAQYMLQNTSRSPGWRTHVPALISFVEERLVRGLNSTGEPSVFFGANTVSEQVLDRDKMGVHTMRYAATLAIWADAVAAETGPSEATRAALAKARRSWDWASYALPPFSDDVNTRTGLADQSALDDVLQVHPWRRRGFGSDAVHSGRARHVVQHPDGGAVPHAQADGRQP